MAGALSDGTILDWYSISGGSSSSRGDGEMSTRPEGSAGGSERVELSRRASAVSGVTMVASQMMNFRGRAKRKSQAKIMTGEL